jgi:ABC-type polysaccharide/polyol phosphate transport system ATPase subunit
VSSLSASDLATSAATPDRQDVSVTTPISVRVSDLHVTYRVNVDRRPTMSQAVRRLGRRERVVHEIAALRGLTFDVPQGQVLGVIGANGAGKSTLMRTLAGILPPSQGRVEVHGRVSTLLALGVGFNSKLTGRDNVILGGLAAGLSRAEIAERYDEIAAFADLPENAIERPMRTYSSGMYSRLAFAVAVHMEPDILIVDEALSTGDAKFKKKSLDRMKLLCDQARTIFLVSHGLNIIKKLCSDVIWLREGTVERRGTPGDVVSAYTRWLEVGDEAVAAEDL